MFRLFEKEVRGESSSGINVVLQVRFPTLRPDPLAHETFPRSDRVDSLQKFRSRIDLGDISVRPGAQGILHHLQRIVLAQEDDV